MWLKAWHLIGMVTWFAGLFYLPRLFVYHAMSDDRISRERFKVMERQLFYGITTPGGLFTVIIGLWMLYDYAWSAFGSHLWLQIKLVLLVLLPAGLAAQQEGFTAFATGQIDDPKVGLEYAACQQQTVERRR